MDRKAVNRVDGKVNEILNDLVTDNLSDANKLFGATSVYVGKKLGLRNFGGKEK